MESSSGKMSRKFDCPKCSATFSKVSFLKQHQRLLNHIENFECDVCRKSFSRMDNLVRHKLKHQAGTSFACPHCNKLFSRADSLNRHRQQHFTQYGGSLKRPFQNDEGDGPIPKKRLTKDSNLEDFYSIRVLKESHIPKFQTKSTNYEIVFKDLEVTTLPDILKTLKRLFQSIIENITEFMEPTDLVRLSVGCPDLDFPITVPFQRLSQLNAESLLSEIERVLQSYEQFVLDETLDIESIHVSIPKGGVGKRFHFVDLPKMLQNKRCFIQIKNHDNLCLARSLVTAKARIDQHDQWDSIRQGRKIQADLAIQLHKEAGVSLTRCGLEEVNNFQNVLKGYQINILSKEHFNGIIFCGPDADKRIYLYHHDNHFDVITSMPAFLCKNYFCVRCKSGYDHVSKHKCNNPCTSCHHVHEEGENNWVYCDDCNRHFRNKECFELHKKSTKYGNSTCKTHFKCNVCSQLINTRMHKKPHKCGESYCKTCKDFMDKNHKCYMTPVSDSQMHAKQDIDGEKKNIFIFFDFECTQDELLECENGYVPGEKGKCRNCNKYTCGSHKHNPNLCIAHKVCSVCLNRELSSSSECEHCGKNEVIFSGADTTDKFCQWLFSEPNYGAKVLCHNFKAYDSYPILQYLYNNSILPEVITTGSKFLSITVPQCKIKFLDSINFIPMPLADLPEAFELVELSKGYFPHLFNRKENQNILLPNLPDIKFYQPDGMKPEKRKVFMTWYCDHQNDSFNFKEELVLYCRSDVDILRRACLKFRTLFIEITSQNGQGIDPFDNCITIASACNLVFRTNYLKSESLAIIPAHGYRPQQNQSIKAINWLKYISETEQIDIQHALNKGEKKIGPYTVDGYVELNGDKYVYEFHGCFWHGCPKCFTAKTKNPVNDSLMSDLYQRTLDKRCFLENQGYKYISMWECDFERECKENEKLYKQVKASDLVSPLEPRDAFYGGRTEVFTLLSKASNDEVIKYFDVTSLYPFVNKTGKFPFGHPKIVTENFVDISQYEGLVKCKVVPPRNLFIPVLPSKINGKLMFTLCKKCTEQNSQTECCHTEDERSITGTWTSDELKKALEKGYEIKKLYEIWHFDEISQYDPIRKCGGIFTDYVNTFLKMKQEASGWPTWCKDDDDKRKYINDYFEKEGIWLDANNIRWNPGLRSIAKLMLNSFWGKFGQRSNLTQTTYITEPVEYFAMMTSENQIIKNCRFVSDEMVHIDWCYKDDFIEVSARTNVVVAAYTTAQARLKLYHYLENLNERTLYCDTDSVIFISKKGEWEPKLGDYLGDMTDELSDKSGINNIVTFVGAGPKNYAYELARPDKKGHTTKCVVKGITLNYRNTLVLNFDTVQDMVTGTMKGNLTIRNETISRDKKTTSLITIPEEKDYRIVFNKRVIQNNYKTLPYGF